MGLLIWLPEAWAEGNEKIILFFPLNWECLNWRSVVDFGQMGWLGGNGWQTRSQDNNSTIKIFFWVHWEFLNFNTFCSVHVYTESRTGKGAPLQYVKISLVIIININIADMLYGYHSYHVLAKVFALTHSTMDCKPTILEAMNRKKNTYFWNKHYLIFFKDYSKSEDCTRFLLNIFSLGQWAGEGFLGQGGGISCIYKKILNLKTWKKGYVSNNQISFFQGVCYIVQNDICLAS